LEPIDLNEQSPDAIREFKTALKKEALNSLWQKKVGLQTQLVALQEAASADTKSSAGDKYETGRESIRQSRTLLEKQWNTLAQWESAVQALPVEPTPTVSEGALVVLDIGWVWVSVSFGKIIFRQREIQSVSSASPLVQALKGKGKGEAALFRGKAIEIRGLM